jgi:NADP-dependent 3-hydroxy acid dehydrogenase YdfG
VLLENKNAIVYGGGGSVGGAVARAFCREGARVFLAGRTLATLDKVAEEVRAGGVAETAQVDALDERAVERRCRSSSSRPIGKAMRNQFLSARAVARHVSGADRE